MDDKTLILVLSGVGALVILYFLIKAAVSAGTERLLASVNELVALKKQEAAAKQAGVSPSVASLQKLLARGELTQAEYDEAVANKK